MTTEYEFQEGNKFEKVLKEAIDTAITKAESNENPNHVREQMKKLKYINVNTSRMRENFLDEAISEFFYVHRYDKSLLTYTFEKICDLIIDEQREDYDEFCKEYDNSIKRSIELSQFIDTNNYVDFYKKLTINEFKKLGFKI